jgi:predicted RNA-binding protein with PUA-like domain
MQYWLMKNEPECYSLEDLKRDGSYTWDGVRNYQARNLMRQMEVGDLVLYYYSNANPSGVAGIAKVVKAPYPDPSQFNKKSEYYDAKATKEDPRWTAVDVAFVAQFKDVISLAELKLDPFYADMLVTKKGMRLSVQPVQEKHYKRLCKHATI